MRKSLLFTVYISLLIILCPAISLGQNVIKVTDCNLNGWLKQPIGSSSLGFQNDATNPPLGTGSMKFNVPAGGIFWPGDFVRFRNGQYSGTLLSSLTELSYSTYVDARDTIADIHFLVVLVDINGDGSAEHNLVFDPRYQNPAFTRSTMPDQGITREHIWQNWDALHGGWFYGGVAITDPDHDGPYFTMAEYLSQYPNARIRNDAAKGGPAIRLSAGGVVFKANFYGSIDNFKIGINGNTTTYDFDFSIADAGADKHVVYGYGSNCVTLNAAASGGVAPYSYSWSPGASAPGSSTTQVCPTVTSTYTLTITDKNGCIRTDDVTVFVNDVHCGNKMDKVMVCHNDKPICVSKDAIPDHLSHGDVLGLCTQPSAATKNITIIAETEASKLKISGFPNPFFNRTSIKYFLPFDGRVSIKLYDVSGKLLKTLVNADKKAGENQYELFRGDLLPGFYYAEVIYTTPASCFSKTQKLLILSGK
jgi:hypothetical protein